MVMSRVTQSGRIVYTAAAFACTLAPADALTSKVAAQAMARPERLFYYVDTEDAYESLRQHISQITVVAPTGYSVDEFGVVWGDVDPRVIRLAKEHGVAVMPLIVNPGFDQEMLHRLLVDDAARARAVAWMVEICRRNDYAGIQFDFENVSIQDRDALTRFYRETAEALHADGRKISIAVVHRPDELPGPTRYHKWLFENWRAGYDLRALAEIGDFISVMTYSQHTRRTPPGPQASVAWMEDVIEYFLQFMPPGKLSLGIPTSSQHWYTSQEDALAPERARSYSNTIDHRRAVALIERYGAKTTWDEEHQTSFAYFARGGTFEWIFLEDARSFRSKLGLVGKHGLRGFSVWVLGSEDPAIWTALAR
jgi:spore germination protein YaaH